MHTPSTTKAGPALMALVVVIVVVVLLSPHGQPQAPMQAVSFALPQSGSAPSVQRISQADPRQYASGDDYATWWPSACSAASMTEVINAYGHSYRIADILHVEAALGEITPEQGLRRNAGIDHTVARFGFTAHWLSQPSLEEVITRAQRGTPVIVNFPPSRWPGGHFLLVKGGNQQDVFLVDSSRLNMQTMTRGTFARYWGGTAVVVMPAGAP